MKMPASRRNGKRGKSRAAWPIHFWPSHSKFDALVEYCARGHSNPDIQSGAVDDHVADLCMLLNEDVDQWLWTDSGLKQGLDIREMLDELELRVHEHRDLRAAATIYAAATHASFKVLSFYFRCREIFDAITPQRRMLPCLLSIHPQTKPMMERLFDDARLGTRTEYRNQVMSRSFFVSDAPANIYARAIVISIEMNREILCPKCQQMHWLDFDKKHQEHTVVLPPPKWTTAIKGFTESLAANNVLRYWNLGKRIILEELPNFHDRPEWRNYRRRKYRNGAKTSAIRHAIFKDILAALRSIAGANRTAGKPAHQTT